jgi:hypothetical protein
MANPTSSDVQRDEADYLCGANHLVVIILDLGIELVQLALQTVFFI